MGASEEVPSVDASFLSSDSDGEDDREGGALFTPTTEAVDAAPTDPVPATIGFGTQTACDTIDPRDGAATVVADVGIQTRISGLSMDLNVRGITEIGRNPASIRLPRDRAMPLPHGGAP